MSLLNDMLRDLENNKNPIFQTPVSQTAGPDELAVDLDFAMESENHMRSIRLMLLVVLVALFVYVGFSMVGRSNSDAAKNPALPDSSARVITHASDTAIFNASSDLLVDNIYGVTDAFASSLNLIKKIMLAVSDPLLTEANLKSIVHELPSIAADTQKKVEERPQPREVKQAEIVDVRPAAKKSDQYLQISKSAHSLDLEAVVKAQALIEKNAHMEAENILLLQIEKNADAVVSVQMLADLYFDRGAQAELASLSATTRFSDNSLRAYVLARHYALTGENKLALSLLLGEQPHPLIAEKYLGLQAALYQQTGAYSEAEKLYETLLGKNLKSATLWLGYALACDANNNSVKALRAYQQVLQTNPANPQVRNYVQSRIELLTANPAERG